MAYFSFKMLRMRLELLHLLAYRVRATGKNYVFHGQSDDLQDLSYKPVITSLHAHGGP